LDLFISINNSYEANMLSQHLITATSNGRLLWHDTRPAIEEETSWRRSNYLHDSRQLPIIAVGHWTEHRKHPYELTASELDHHYVIDVQLDDSFISCYRGEQRIANGRVSFGATQITAPGQKIRCHFSKSSEAIHVFMPRSVLVAAYEDINQKSCPAGFELRDPRFTVIESLGRLGRALVDTSALAGPCGTLCSESLSMAVLTQLMALQQVASHSDSAGMGLSPLRQRLAVDYIEANLREQISLQDIAKQVGLSRMHFAAQFRLSTGTTPHAFLLYRRLEKAKNLLQSTGAPLDRIAKEVGFPSHSYFTSVFRKLVGTTPRQWRVQSRPKGGPTDEEEPQLI
jgi:AraC family transcriptional regulator